jgi:photosystem II stability/assembly factor-like uncharacterized protein
MDISCADTNLCFIAGGSNGVGFGVFYYDGQLDGQVYQMNMVNASEIVMSVIGRGSSAQPIGVAGGVSTFFTPGFPPLHFYDGSNKQWNVSSSPFEFATVIPSIAATKDGQTIIGLNPGQPSGVMVSTNAGNSFTLIPLKGFPSANFPNCTAPNYVAVGDNATWYMILGQSPSTASSSSSGQSSSFDSSERLLQVRHRRQLITAKMDKHNKYTVKAEPNAAHLVNPAHVDSGETCFGYSVQIIKTSDGGQTWTAQLSEASSDYTLFDIDCLDANTCVAVGSGDLFSVVYMMTNGKTWSRAFKVSGNNNTGIPLMQIVRFVNRTDIWIGGSWQVPAQQAAEGLFYFSKDGGKTFLQYPTLQPEVAVVMAMTFVKGEGFATGITTEQSSTVLRYTNQPYYGYFEQVSCLTNSCSLLCQSTMFPQGMCLQSGGGGGVKAFCQTSGLSIQQYQTTDCSGSYTSSVSPINTCMNSTNGGPFPYFENVCGSSFQAEQTMSPVSARKFHL